MAFGDDDIPEFFLDGDVATFADNSSVNGFLDFPEEIDPMGGQIRAGGAVAQRATFTCDAANYAKFEAAGRGAAITVKNMTMKIKDWHRIDDGRLMQVKLGGQ